MRRRLSSQRSAAVLALLGAVLFAGWGFMFLEANARLGPEQPTAEAVVVGRSGRATVLEFSVDGRTVRAATEDVVGVPEEGDRFRVRYDPVDPDLYVRDATVPDTPAWFIGATFVISASFLVMAVQGWRRRLPGWFLDSNPWAGDRAH